MDMTLETCRKFVEVLASNAPAPGGGGAAALVGAIGTALGNMVGSLTVGKKKYAGVEAEIIALKERCDALQTELLDQVEADDKGFVPLAKAYGIPALRMHCDAVREQAPEFLEGEGPKLLEVMLEHGTFAYPKTCLGEPIHNQQPYAPKEVYDRLMEL